VLSLIESAPPEIFWPAFMAEWGKCDRTWDQNRRLLQALKKAGNSFVFLSPAQRAFLERLPPQVEVFRGCSAPRVRGVAWTTDRMVAEGFARGHRRTRVPDQVVASGFILKEHIFFVTDKRSEKEIVLDPGRLRKLVIERLDI
jgi:hypothetical protein